MEKFYYKSLIGVLEIICTNDKLISLKLTDKTEISYEDAEKVEK